jgi:hypothetical protein
VRKAGFSLAGRGSIRVRWLPSPTVAFQASGRVSPRHAFHDLGEFVLEAPAIGLRAPALAAESTQRLLAPGRGIPFETSGTLLGPLPIRYSRARLARILFHVPNFYDFIGPPIPSGSGRGLGSASLTMQGGEWTVTLDRVPNVANLVKALRVNGGYGVTHVGQLEVSAPETLSWKRAELMFDLLFYCLSFARGAWCGPILKYGWTSGPVTLTKLRNGMAHPRQLQRSYATTALQRYEARQLSLWYLELSILRLVGFTGRYGNRLRRSRWKGQVEKVPWA